MFERDKEKIGVAWRHTCERHLINKIKEEKKHTTRETADATRTRMCFKAAGDHGSKVSQETTLSVAWEITESNQICRIPTTKEKGTSKSARTLVCPGRYCPWLLPSFALPYQLCQPFFRASALSILETSFSMLMWHSGKFFENVPYCSAGSNRLHICMGALPH